MAHNNENLEAEQTAELERITASIERLQEAVRVLPVLDARTPEEILGYDEYGLPA